MPTVANAAWRPTISSSSAPAPVLNFERCAYPIGGEASSCCAGTKWTCCQVPSPSRPWIMRRSARRICACPRHFTSATAARLRQDRCAGSPQGRRGRQRVPGRSCSPQGQQGGNRRLQRSGRGPARLAGRARSDVFAGDPITTAAAISRLELASGRFDLSGQIDLEAPRSVRGPFRLDAIARHHRYRAEEHQRRRGKKSAYALDHDRGSAAGQSGQRKYGVASQQCSSDRSRTEEPADATRSERRNAQADR